MKTMKHWNAALLLGAGMAISACGPKEQAPSEPPKKEFKELKKAEWILGTWQNASPEGVATEAWTRATDSSFSGSSHFVIGSDTVSSEKLQLVEASGVLQYIPTVQGQNDGKPVVFKLTKASDKELVFENPAHDFPTKISYRQVRPDSIVAEISGVMEGAPMAQAFPMKRVN